jgi:hypothetical protein
MVKMRDVAKAKLKKRNIERNMYTPTSYSDGCGFPNKNFFILAMPRHPPLTSFPSSIIYYLLQT